MTLGKRAANLGMQSEAADYYLRAAQRGHLLAMNEVANRYARGLGLIKDAVTAFDWELKAALAGDPTAQMKVGIAYYEGQGVMPNPIEAISSPLPANSQLGEEKTNYEHGRRPNYYSAFLFTQFFIDNFKFRTNRI